MTVLPIRIFGDPVLRAKARPVVEFGPQLGRLVDDMIETMNAASGAGLAAPQVGVLQRLFVYDLGDGPKVVCNPELSDFSGTWTHEEGCLSLPGVYVEIDRPMHVTCRYQDREGKWHEVRSSELEGRVFQHETDHCDGIWFIDRAEKSERRLALREFRHRFSADQTQWVPDLAPPKTNNVHKEAAL